VLGAFGPRLAGQLVFSALYVAISLAVAVVVFRLYKLPFLRLKRRFEG